MDGLAATSAVRGSGASSHDCTWPLALRQERMTLARRTGASYVRLMPAPGPRPHRHADVTTAELIGGVEKRRLVVVDYDPSWPAIYARHEDRIRSALGAVAVDIEHIGSTAVPGLAAKPIIDILVTVNDSSSCRDAENFERRAASYFEQPATWVPAVQSRRLRESQTGPGAATGATLPVARPAADDRVRPQGSPSAARGTLRP